jgi:hypothetical protein
VVHRAAASDRWDATMEGAQLIMTAALSARQNRVSGIDLAPRLSTLIRPGLASGRAVVKQDDKQLVAAG